MTISVTPSKVRFGSTLASRLSASPAVSRVSSATSPTVALPSSLRTLIVRSLRLSSAPRSSLEWSVARRWCHSQDWRTPAGLRAQARIASPGLERFERRIATMASEHPFKEIFTSLPNPGGGEFWKYYSLPSLNDPRIDRLPYSIRILLESAIRNCDNFQVTKDDIEKILDWENTAPKLVEIPFKPARVLLQDLTGLPLLLILLP